MMWCGICEVDGCHHTVERAASLALASIDDVRAALAALHDPRDTEIAALKAEVDRLRMRVAKLSSGSEAANLAGRVVEQDKEIARLRRALAAGPAALRDHYAEVARFVMDGWVSAAKACYEQAALDVERAQAEAMKEDGDG